MKQNISILMDGELFEDEAASALDQLKRHREAQEEWKTYHLIRDVLRHPDHVRTNISASMQERLQAEPTVLAPRRVGTHKVKLFALSAAASVLALTLVAWLSVQVGSQPEAQMAAVRHSPDAAFAARYAPNNLGINNGNLAVNNGLNDFLMAHQEFSPSINVQGAAPYIRTVAGQ